MTTIITRLFPKHDVARYAVERLAINGISSRSCTIIDAGDGAKERLENAGVDGSAVARYAKGLKAGNAALTVRAAYKPLGAARMTREILERIETVDAGDVVEDRKVSWQPERAKNVLKDHPRFLTLPDSIGHGPVTSSFGLPMTKPHSTKRPLSNKRSSTGFWPMDLISNKDRSNKVMSGGRRVSQAFWPMPLLSTGPRTKSVIPGGGAVFSRMIGLRTISRR